MIAMIGSAASALWARAPRWLVAAVAIACAVAVAWWSGRRTGTASARTRAMESDIRNRKTRDAVERDVARLPDPSQRLRDEWSRD